MIGIESYLAIVLAFAIVTTSPGPANIAVATIAMSNGRRPGVLFALGLSVGLAFWGLIAATGMGAILEASSVTLSVLKLVGGIYLLWLAFQSGRAALSKSSAHEIRLTNKRWFIRGMALNLSNPKSVAAWMAALSMGLSSGSNSAAILAATLMCVAVGFANFIGYALAFSLPSFASGYKRISRWINAAVAGLFAAAGVGLIRSALTR